MSKQKANTKLHFFKTTKAKKYVSLSSQNVTVVPNFTVDHSTKSISRREAERVLQLKVTLRFFFFYMFGNVFYDYLLQSKSRETVQVMERMETDK